MTTKAGQHGGQLSNRARPAVKDPQKDPFRPKEMSRSSNPVERELSTIGKSPPSETVTSKQVGPRTRRVFDRCEPLRQRVSGSAECSFRSSPATMSNAIGAGAVDAGGDNITVTAPSQKHKIIDSGPCGGQDDVGRRGTFMLE